MRSWAARGFFDFLDENYRFNLDHIFYFRYLSSNTLLCISNERSRKLRVYQICYKSDDLLTYRSAVLDSLFSIILMFFKEFEV